MEIQLLKHFSKAAYLIFMVAMVAQATNESSMPKKIQLIYQATRNGQPFATVTENYQVNQGHYKIESITEGQGVFALFGKRMLTSEGTVTDMGLRPDRFQSTQGDNPQKSLTSIFDWKAKTLSMLNKGKTEVVTLKPATQDLSSFMYQFMYKPPNTDEVVMEVTTGKKLREYHYRVIEKDIAIDTNIGSFKTLHIGNTGSDKNSDEKELWLAKDKNYLPVKLRIQEENGSVIEQILTEMHVE